MTQPCPECDAASHMTKELITDDGYRETARRDYRCPACGRTFFYIETVNPLPVEVEEAFLDKAEEELKLLDEARIALSRRKYRERLNDLIVDLMEYAYRKGREGR